LRCGSNVRMLPLSWSRLDVFNLSRTPAQKTPLMDPTKRGGDGGASGFCVAFAYTYIVFCFLPLGKRRAAINQIKAISRSHCPYMPTIISVPRHPSNLAWVPFARK